MNVNRFGLAWLLLACIWSTTCLAQEFDEQFSHWPADLKINGRIIVDNGLQDLDSIRPFLERIAGGSDLICLRAAGESSDASLFQELRKAVGKSGSVTEITSTTLPTSLLKSALASAHVIYVESIADDAKSLISMKSSFRRLIDRGGVVIMSAAVAETLGEKRVSRSDDNDQSKILDGMNLLPNSILHCSEQDDDSATSQMLKLVTAHTRTVGIVLERGTAIALNGRKATCFGSGKATFVLPAANSKPPRIESISFPRSARQPPETYLVDLTEWRRDAMDRDLPNFPPKQPKKPNVSNGTLLIVGGGGSPAGLMDRFIELAGGVENAKLVYVPCSEDEDVGDRHSLVRLWKSRGVKHATFIHTKDRQRANSDEAFFEPLKEATGVFFGGGRQWNFSDSYYGTKTHELMKNVLKRGGVIAGSSAGASIQARYLARSTPIGNYRIMAPGYERGGLGFISGVAIDQHFSQRKRQADMTQLMKVHPQLLGIGLDEATAIEVQKSIAKVSGRGRVFFYDTNRKNADHKTDYIALPAGSTYDLAARKIIIDATPREDALDDDNQAEKTNRTK